MQADNEISGNQEAPNNLSNYQSNGPSGSDYNASDTSDIFAAYLPGAAEMRAI